MKETDKAESRLGVIGRLDVPLDMPERHEKEWIRKGAKHGWYLSGANGYPLEHRLFEADLRQLIRDYVLPGHAPREPLLDVTDSVVTLGSCFARELRAFLTAAGVDSQRFWIPSGLNNTFAILDFFSWCVTGHETGRGYRYERSELGEVTEWTPEGERHSYVEAFARAGAFVFTIGLAEVWQDRRTGSVFWRGVPAEIFDEDRHVFRLTTVEENTANLREIIRLVRQINERAPIILTLSPVPLLASFRDISCLTADCVSKSVLRVALDQIMNDRLESVYYWPSFEIVKWVGAHLPYSAYAEDGKARDVNRHLIAAIIDMFVEAFYTPTGRAALRA